MSFPIHLSHPEFKNRGIQYTKDPVPIVMRRAGRKLDDRSLAVKQVLTVYQCKVAMGGLTSKRNLTPQVQHAPCELLIFEPLQSCVSHDTLERCAPRHNRP